METVNVNGESNDNRGRQMIEKRRLLPHIITLPPSKTCTTGARLESLQISVVDDDPAAGVLREGTICDNMSRVIHCKGCKVGLDNSGGCGQSGNKKNNSFEHNGTEGGQGHADSS